MLQFLEAISKIAKDGVDGMKLSMEFDMAHEDRYGRKNLRKVY